MLGVRIRHRLAKLYWKLAKPITLGVRVLLLREGQVMLVRHRYGRSYWYLPGGGVHHGESVEQAASRELSEEVGAVPEQLQLFGIYDNFREGKSDHIVVFTCDDFALQAPSQTGEIANYLFFPLTELPTNISPGTRRRLRECCRTDFKLLRLVNGGYSDS